MRTTLSVLVLAVVLLSPARAIAACADLATLNLPNTTVTRAEVVAPGGFTTAGPAASQALYARLPEFCRVGATLRPSADSEIRIEVWLPTQSSST